MIKALSHEATARLRHWLALAGIGEGALFRSVPRSNPPTRFGTQLGDRDVARIYKRLAAAVGIDPADIAGHSTRIGSTQDLLAAGYTGAEIQRQVGWKSERMVIRYSEHLEAKRGAMARFLKGRASRQE